MVDLTGRKEAGDWSRFGEQIPAPSLAAGCSMGHRIARCPAACGPNTWRILIGLYGPMKGWHWMLTELGRILLVDVDADSDQCVSGSPRTFRVSQYGLHTRLVCSYLSMYRIVLVFLGYLLLRHCLIECRSAFEINAKVSLTKTAQVGKKRKQGADPLTRRFLT